MLDDEANRSLLLKKHKLNKHLSQLREPRPQLVNSNGIVSAPRLLLIACLIILSVASMQRANSTHWPHVKAITNHFSFYALGQDGLSIYDRGNNLDETYIELALHDQQKEHFRNLVAVIEGFEVDGFANFSHEGIVNVDAQFYYSNGQSVKLNLTFAQFKQVVLDDNLRELLLNLRVMYYEIDFGSNELVDSLRLALDYEIFSHSMLGLQMSTKYKPKAFGSLLRTETVLRYLQRLVSVILILAYSVEARKLYYNRQLEKTFRKNSIYWCLSLIVLNFLAVISTTLAPFCAMMQLLPVLENYDSSNSLTYNFNVNLRYALPIVFRVLVPVFIIMSGFILYSMLMYPGSYFDDYVTGFFSYFYNNFQYGIYEIFIEIRSRGNSAYLLYVILYFYMVLVGSNLAPALFCTLIYQKMAEKELVRFIEAKLDLIVCPNCHQELYAKKNYGIEINVNSPSSPYLRKGITLKHSPKNVAKTAKLFIEETQEEIIKSPIHSPIMTLKSKHKRARDLVNDLKECVEVGFGGVSRGWMEQKLLEIQDMLQNF